MMTGLPYFATYRSISKERGLNADLGIRFVES